ncbi:PREDICTED: nucleolin 2 isoform X5 [Brassica oleracea var. oleracea]|uniref:nucleolin 2 isoform X5 n=1 Tax=Brassica oleracea var. oleracea TaxID=109376 RepID=UPI0006A74F24|nr:PREDICTED: nucleolin 2 isoform X5 [Brassica oleracea var. oleracea]
MVKSKKESVKKVEAAPVSTTKPSKKSKRDAEVDLDIKKNPKKQKKEVVQAEKKAPPPKKVETSSSSSDSEEEVKTKKAIAKKPLSKKDDSSSSSDEEAVTVKKKPATLKKAKAESSSSDDSSSSSDEEPAVVKKDSSSEEESSSDEESVPAKKQPTTTLKAAKAESSSSSEDESSSDEESAPPKKQPTVVKSVKPAAKDSSSSEDEDSEDEKKKEPATKKLPAAAKTKSDSSEEDSDDEESDDEKPPTKKAKVSPTKTSKQESSSGESSEEESEDEKVVPKKKDTDVEMAEAEQKSEAKQPKTPTTQRPTTQARGGSTTLFAGNLPFQIEKSDVENFFKEVGGIVDVRFASHPDGRLKGYGHFEFASAEAAQKALKLMNGKPLLGRTIRLSDANAKPAPRSSNADGNFQSNRKGEGSQVKTIFVSKFDKSVAERDMRCALREHFSDCGEITRISLPCDQETGATRGMAYLDFINEDGFNKALELNGSELGGWNILVLEGKPRGWNSDGNNDGDRFTATRPGRRPPGRGTPGRSRPGRAPPGRGDRRTPSKPSVFASAEGKKIVFDD